MHGFDLAAVLITVAAMCGYVNHRVLRLPATTGTLAVALLTSLLVVAMSAAFPDIELRSIVARRLDSIDFNQILMRGMLSFLLFAGALHLDLEGLLANKRTIGVLATVGVAISTIVVGSLMWWCALAFHIQVSALACFVFGALISPTDPIAVMGLLKELHAPRDLEAKIAGESLFNDGIGVVVFVALVSLAGLSATPHAIVPTARGVALFFAREVGGGIALGGGLGYATYRILMTIDDHPLELLMTLALVMSTYAVALNLHVSGPIAVVVAGLLIGNPGRQFAMSPRTREHVDAFWSVLDEILNTVLFLLLGLQVFAIHTGAQAVLAGMISIVIVLLARLISVALPVAVLNLGRVTRGLVPVLTWSGLRGGLSVAMALSLPPFPARDLLMSCTYSVVVFSILVQGTTVRRVLVHYGVGAEPRSS